MKLAFGWLVFHSFVWYSADDGCHILLVLFPTVQIYEDIVQIYYPAYIDI